MRQTRSRARRTAGEASGPGGGPEQQRRRSVSGLVITSKSGKIRGSTRKIFGLFGTKKVLCPCVRVRVRVCVSTDHLLFGFSVEPPRCSVAPLLAQRRLTLLDIVTPCPKVSRPVIGPLRSGCYSCASGLRVCSVCECVCVVVRGLCEDLTVTALKSSGCVRAARNSSQSQSPRQSPTMTRRSAFTQAGCPQLASNDSIQQLSGDKITMC